MTNSTSATGTTFAPSVNRNHVIRTMTAEDIDWFTATRIKEFGDRCQFSLEGFKEFQETLIKHGEQLRSSLTAQARSSSSQFDGAWVATIDDKLVGSAMCQISTDQEGVLALLHNLVVDRDHQRQKIGTALLSEVESFAGRCGTGLICANPFTVMTEASSLLGQQGYSLTGYDETMVMHGKELYREHWEKRLDTTADPGPLERVVKSAGESKEKSSRWKLSRLLRRR